MIEIGPGILVGPGIQIGQFPVFYNYVFFITETLDENLCAENGAQFVEEY